MEDVKGRREVRLLSSKEEEQPGDDMAERGGGASLFASRASKEGETRAERSNRDVDKITPLFVEKGKEEERSKGRKRKGV